MREREVEKMKPSSNNKEKNHQLKEEGFQSSSTTVSCFYYITFTAIITIFSLHLIFNTKNITYSNSIHNLTQPNSFIQPSNEIESCDLFKGEWIQEPNATLYTDSCPEIPLSKNCLVQGRNDTDYLNWKWKPDQCELPRFDAVSFLSILRGKKMAFIGDSLARNQVESLVCLLSMVETPKSVYENRIDKDRTWEFPEYNFTLAVFWSPFFVPATKIPHVNGYHVNLDRVEAKWSEDLLSIDYAIFSGSHWFYRENRLHENGTIVGCVRCHNTNLPNVGPGRAIGPAFRAALLAVNGCRKCKKRIVSFVRTFSHAHFEHGGWSTGGRCTRTQPMTSEEVDRADPGWGYRKIQLEEVEMARNEGKENGKGNEFEVLDVTEMMATRADGHPDRFWGLTKGSDCLHWCLPGPVDMWNWLLLQRIKRLDSITSDLI